MESIHKVVKVFKKSDLSPNSKILCPNEYKLVLISLNKYPRLVKYVKILKVVALSSFVKLETSLDFNGFVDFPTHSITKRAYFIDPLR